jgi:hypothetical protein
VKREDAAAKVALLREVTVARGATEGEAAVASRLAAKLVQAYQLDEAARSSSWWRQQAPAPTPAGDDIGRVRDAFRHMYSTPEEARKAMQDLSGYWFDPTTGESSGNVTVHQYSDRANWKIEIFP